jgi:CheY-like chemotaxis protein
MALAVRGKPLRFKGSEAGCGWYTGRRVGSSPGCVVLLVEDDQVGRRLYAALLEQAGFHVVEAHNGLQALERAVELRPDVVVTDLNIPGIDGYELTRRLKGDPRTGGIPILAVTGYVAFTQDPDRAGRAGCDAILAKPCSAEDLERTMRSLIEEARRPRSA